MSMVSLPHAIAEVLNDDSLAHIFCDMEVRLSYHQLLPSSCRFKFTTAHLILGRVQLARCCYIHISDVYDLT